jgi:hypothetical protein
MNDSSGDAPADYVWVNEEAEFALCKVTSECTTSHDVSEELQSKLTNENGTKIYNIRHVEWTDIPVEFVPGYVKRKFTGRFGTLNKLDKGVDEHAKKVIKELHSVDDFENKRTIEFELLESKLESIGSTGDSQAKYECELRRVTDGVRQSGLVQVKSGDATLNLRDFSELAEQHQVFLFSSPDDNGENKLSVDQYDITLIDPTELRDHLQCNLQWLPTTTLLRLSSSL